MKKEVLIIHPFPEGGGGAEIQLFRNIKALQELEYNVHIQTFYNIDKSDVKNLAKKCGIEIDEITTIGIIANRYDQINFRIPKLLAYSICLSKAKKIKCNYDLIHTILGECTIDKENIIQHFCIPLFSIKLINLRYLGFLSNNYALILFRKIYVIICRIIAGYNKEIISKHNSLCNSNWTGEVTKREYPKLCKIDTIYFWPKVIFNKEKKILNFGERLDNIIMLGRIVESKNYKLGIKLVNILRRKGYNYRLIIVGRSDSLYSDKLRKITNDNNNIEIIADADRSYIFNLCKKSKFGLHCYKYEHFGSAAVEMRAASLPTFVPNQGGQAEIVDNTFTYQEINQVAEKIVYFHHNTNIYKEYSLKGVENSFIRNDKTYINLLINYIKKYNG